MANGWTTDEIRGSVGSDVAHRLADSNRERSQPMMVRYSSTFVASRRRRTSDDGEPTTSAPPFARHRGAATGAC
jgi:hypothetical protein